MTQTATEWLEIFKTTDQAGTLPAVVKAVRDLEARSTPKLNTLKVRFLRNYGLENIAAPLKYEGLRHGFRTDITFSEFDGFETEASDSRSTVYTTAHDLVVLTLWLDGFVPKSELATFDPRTTAERVKRIAEQLLQGTHSNLVLTTFLEPTHLLRELNAGSHRDSFSIRLRQLNLALLEFAHQNSRVIVMDLDRVFAQVGAQKSIDPRFWYMYSSPLTPQFLHQMGRELALILKAARREPRKVLVLDCDNTLWGGVIGEDGIDGIKLSPFDHPGSVYYDLHRQVLRLKSEGVVLALCSKNNEADALEVIERHPHCLIRRSDLVTWQINWDDKATNLRRIAETLNLGLDSIVFLDDSPTECEWVRQAIPEVTVLQVPSNPVQIPAVLQNFRDFDRLNLSSEDLARTAMYQTEQARLDAAKQFASHEEFLASLNLQVDIERARATDLQRVAQLTQKTNQFNLTTRRYSESDIRAFCENPDYSVITLRVSDRFGDYGLTGLIIAEARDAVLRIDTLLMSCRVLGKSIEQAFLRSVLHQAKKSGKVSDISAEYLPTRKNQQVSEFYDSEHFQTTGMTGAPGGKCYRLDLENFRYEAPRTLRLKVGALFNQRIAE